MPYNAIIGRGLAKRLSTNFYNSQSLVTMGIIVVLFVGHKSKTTALFNHDKIEIIGEDSINRLKKILNAKYKPVNLKTSGNDSYELLPDLSHTPISLLKLKIYLMALYVNVK